LPRKDSRKDQGGPRDWLYNNKRTNCPGWSKRGPNRWSEEGGKKSNCTWLGGKTANYKKKVRSTGNLEASATREKCMHCTKELGGWLKK